MRKTSLRTKLLVSVGVIIFIVLGTSSFLHIQDLQRDYLEALEWRSEALAQRIINDVIEKYKLNPAINEMLGVFSIQCAQIYEVNQEKNVTHVAVIDPSNVIAAHNDKALWNTPVESPVLLDNLSRHKLITVLDGTIYHTLVPIIADDDAYLGTVDIGFPQRLVDEKVRQILRQSLGLFALFVLGTVIAISILVHLVVTKPLRHLITVGKKITRGELVQMRQSEAGQTISRAGKGSSSDEIGVLTAVFRDMMSYLQDMANAATRIATGDLSQEITSRSEGDVLGTAFHQMSVYLNTMASAATTIAEGDLRQEIQPNSKHDVLAGAFHTMNQQLKEAVVQVKSAADNIAEGSQEMRSNSEEMSEGASQQASSAEEVSSSMQEMVANIRQNADNARQTEKIALQSAQYAEEGSKVVAETVVAMKQIAQKIRIIQEIADQTRMLSLNATIEAARAQEHGKAFSVVAAEVRQLSDVTKRAAEEIDQLITSSLEVSEQAGEMLTTLVPSIHKTAELVQEISAASSEQSTGAEHINTALQQLDQVTQQNAAASENVASAAEELAAQAEQLRSTMMFFRIDEGFLLETLDKVEKGTTSPLQTGTTTGKVAEDTQQPHEDIELTKPEDEEGKPATGHVIELGRGEADGDELDEEFERY
jgi:methyl-accepting chemotaxis protein